MLPNKRLISIIAFLAIVVLTIVVIEGGARLKWWQFQHGLTKVPVTDLRNARYFPVLVTAPGSEKPFIMYYDEYASDTPNTGMHIWQPKQTPKGQVVAVPVGSGPGNRGEKGTASIEVINQRPRIHVLTRWHGDLNAEASWYFVKDGAVVPEFEAHHHKANDIFFLVQDAFLIDVAVWIIGYFLLRRLAIARKLS